MFKSSLRFKILISLIIFVLIFLGIAIFVSQKIFLTSFSELENREAIKSIERSKVVFDRQIFNLDSRLTDWAVWDDTYYFIQDKNQQYIDSNLTDESLHNLGINSMVFIASTGAIIYEKQINIKTKENINVSKDLESTLFKSKNIISFDSIKDKNSGVIHSPSGLIFFAARPVLKSDATGPIAGTLIFIRYYDKELKDYFEQLNNNNEVEILDYESTVLSKYKQAKEQLSLGKKYYAFPLSSDKIGGFTLIYDYNNKPAYILESELPRVIHILGASSILNFLYFIVILSISGVAFVLVLINKFVVSKIVNLNKDVNKVRDPNSSLNRLEVRGNDEFANLATNINTMLSELENLRLKDEEAAKNYKKLLEQSQKKAADFERMNKLMVGRELKMIELKKEIEDLKAQLLGKVKD